MQQYYPKSWLPANAAAEKSWTPNGIAMSQTYRFHYMWYNRQNAVKDWITESQNHQAWVTRFTTEAFRRNNNMISFAIHLFIDAWPAGWMKSIMDVKRQPKKAYFEYAHALQPLAVSLRTDRYQFYAGEKMAVEAWIANDKKEVPDGAILKYQFEQQGKLLLCGNAPAIIMANKSTFQGFITANAPLIKIRTAITLRLQLVTDKGIPIHETDIVLEIIPSSKAATKMVWIAGNTKAVAANLAKELGMKITTSAADADVLLIDSLPLYQAQKNDIDKWVSEGRTAVFLQPPVGNYVIANDSVHVSKTIMGQYYFVSPSLQHQGMKLFKPNDFWLWYNSNKNLISPLLGEMSQIDGWTSLLTTGQTGWVGSSDYAFAAAEKKMGKGMFRISHLLLDGRIKANPAARKFAVLLIGK